MRWPFAAPTLDRPIFLIGCGRSGTTILGNTLARHRDVTYLNEPRQLWSRVIPEADIWSPDASRNAGRLVLDANACTPQRRRALARAFGRETRATGHPRLVEKLPINAFRLGLLGAAFPDARYLVLLRDGIAVARSIARFAERDTWFGVGDYKWHALAAEAERRPETRGLAALCTSAYERGLLEWRLSVDAAIAHLEGPARNRCVLVRYETLLATPAAEMRRLLAALELRPSPEVERFAEDEIGSQASSDRRVDATPIERKIAGPLLATLGYDRRA
jgi:hypothetical protein